MSFCNNFKVTIVFYNDRIIVTPNFKLKTKCILLYMSGSSFTHKVINSEINSIISVYYIESYYKS
jgi:hypothetical protein